MKILVLNSLTQDRCAWDLKPPPTPTNVATLIA